MHRDDAEMAERADMFVNRIGTIYPGHGQPFTMESLAKGRP